VSRLTFPPTFIFSGLALLIGMDPEISLIAGERFNEWKANIILRMDNDPIVDLRLVEDPDNFISLQNVQQNGISQIYDNISQLPFYIDILRNEKPLYVVLYESAGGSHSRCILQTSTEPVREGE
jgi:hypothetical protein